MQTISSAATGESPTTQSAQTATRSQYRCATCGAVGSAPTHRPDCPDRLGHQVDVPALNVGDVIEADGNFLFPSVVTAVAGGGKFAQSRLSTVDLSVFRFTEHSEFPPFAKVTVIATAADLLVAA